MENASSDGHDEAPNPPVLNDQEAGLLEAISAMLASPAYLFPLAAAQSQYRDHYYGLSSAALLEDLFFDAFTNYLAFSRPSSALERPERGKKGWDYRFDGLEISHKVGLGPQQIAALWDATVKRETWSFETPVVFLSAAYSPKVGLLSAAGVPLNVKTLSPHGPEVLRGGRRLLLVAWAPVGEPRLLWSKEADGEATVQEMLPFAEAWSLIARHIREGVPANHLEFLQSTARPSSGFPAAGDVDEGISIEFEHRSGISVIPLVTLQNVPVVSNNRALLMDKDVVAAKMIAALRLGLFAPLPLWYCAYAQSRPPDQYLAQRVEFDARFSPAARSAQEDSDKSSDPQEEPA